MTWTIWLHEPKPEKAFAPIAYKVEGGLKVDLVSWLDDDAKECRVVSITVDDEGNVTVEHSTTEYVSPYGIDPEHVTRVTLPGWEEW